MGGDWQNKDVLITGGMGFIGSSLAHRLVDEGASVTIIDARLPEYGANPANLYGIQDEVRLLELDVREQSDIENSVKRSDVIYHCAAQLSRTESMRNPQKDTEINCGGLLNVLDTCAGLEDPPRVVFPSSQAVVGKPDELPITGDTPANPIDIYGANKRAGEMYCSVYHRSEDVPVAVARLSNVYGPRAQLANSNYGVIHQFIRSAMDDESLTVFKPGTMTRDFVYINDVVSGLLSLGVEIGVDGERYFIASGRAISIRELASTVVGVFDSGTVKLVEWPDDWDSIRVGDLQADPSRLTEETDWKPETALSEGLRETREYYEENIEHYV